MPDPIVWCKDCQKMLKHMEVQETRIRICSGCGLESSFPKGYKLAATARDLKRENKKEKTMAIKRLTEQEKADIIRRKGAGEKAEAIAADIGVHKSVVYYTCKGGFKVKGTKVYKMGRHIKPDTSDTNVKRTAEKSGATSGSGFKGAIEKMVAEAVDRRLSGLGLDTLDAKIEAAILRALK